MTAGSVPVAFVRETLSSRAVCRPATLKALSSTIGGVFPGGLAEDICVSIVAELQLSGFLAVTGTKVMYA